MSPNVGACSEIRVLLTVVLLGGVLAGVGSVSSAHARPATLGAYVTPPKQGYRWHPPARWLRNAICVHGYEGSWSDMGGPYYGGLQFNRGFENTYGYWWLRRRGDAGRWPIHAQLHAAYRAWQHRGWAPWPQTARMCGLL